MKKYSKPTKPEVWAKYQFFLTVLFIVNFLGICISGSTEYIRFVEVFQIENHTLRISTAIAATLLIELSFLVLLDKGFENIFDFIKSGYKSIPDVIVGIVCLSLAGFVGHLSVTNSTEGKTIAVEQRTPPPVAIAADYTQANQTKAAAKAQFMQDSLLALSSVTTNFNAKKAKIEKRIKKAEGSIAWLDHINKPESKPKYEKRLKAANKELEALPEEKENAFNLALMPIRAEYQSRLKAATEEAKKADTKVALINTTRANTHATKLSRKQTQMGWVVYAAVGSGVVAMLFFHLAMFLSGRNIEYHLNPISYSTKPFAKLITGLRIKWHNLLTNKVDYIVGEEMKVFNSEVHMTQTNTPKKNTTIDTNILDAEEAQNTTTNTDPINTQTPIPNTTAQTPQTVSQHDIQTPTNTRTKHQNTTTILHKNTIIYNEKHYTKTEVKNMVNTYSKRVNKHRQKLENGGLTPHQTKRTQEALQNNLNWLEIWSDLLEQFE